MPRLADLTDDEIAALSDEDLDLLIAQEELSGDALASPAAFAVAHSAGRWEPYEVAKRISDEIVAGVEHDAWDVLIVTAPPRTGKSQLISRWVPAWYVCKHRKRVGLASYEADFAAGHSREARAIVAEHGPMYGVKVRQDSKAAARWEIEGEEAGMWSAGAGGPITGKGFHLGIIDDPIKNDEQARSETFRNNLWEWYQSTFFTRREPGAKIVVLHTRWHFDDLIGRLRTEKYRSLRVRVLDFRALAEDDDPLGRPVGAPLVPQRYTRDDLLAIRESVGSKVWNALYQQRPQRDGGSVFRRSWVRHWRKEGDLYVLEGDTPKDRHLVHEGDLRIFATMDTAYGRTKRSDFTALGVWGVTPGANGDVTRMLLLQGYLVRVEATEHAALALAAWQKWRPMWLGLESTLATQSLFFEIQRSGVVVRKLFPDKSKGARAETAAALYEAGRVYHPGERQETDWLDQWEEQLVSFPAGAHDDAVDVTAYAGIELAKGSVRGRMRDRTEYERDSVDRHVAAFRKAQKRKHTSPIGAFL